MLGTLLTSLYFPKEEDYAYPLAALKHPEEDPETFRSRVFQSIITGEEVLPGADLSQARKTLYDFELDRKKKDSTILGRPLTSGKGFLDNLRAAWEGYVSGTNLTAGNLLKGVEWLLHTGKIPEEQPILSKISEELTSVGSSYAQRSGDTWVSGVGSAVGSIGLFIGLGSVFGAVGGAIGAASSARTITYAGSVLTEAIAEAGGAWQEKFDLVTQKNKEIIEQYIAKGMEPPRELLEDPSKAAHTAATKAFFLNLPLIAVTDKLGLFGEGLKGWKKGIVSALMEGSQEGLQSLVSWFAVDEGKPIEWNDVLYEAALGSIVGGAFSKVLETEGEKMSNSLKYVLKNMPTDVKALYEGIYNAYLFSGVSEEEAHIAATAAILKTKEGLEYAEEVLGALKDVILFEKYLSSLLKSSYDEAMDPKIRETYLNDVKEGKKVFFGFIHVGSEEDVISIKNQLDEGFLYTITSLDDLKTNPEAHKMFVRAIEEGKVPIRVVLPQEANIVNMAEAEVQRMRNSDSWNLTAKQFKESNTIVKTEAGYYLFNLDGATVYTKDHINKSKGFHKEVEETFSKMKGVFDPNFDVSKIEPSDKALKWAKEALKDIHKYGEVSVERRIQKALEIVGRWVFNPFESFDVFKEKVEEQVENLPPKFYKSLMKIWKELHKTLRDERGSFSFKPTAPNVKEERAKNLGIKDNPVLLWYVSYMDKMSEFSTERVESKEDLERHINHLFEFFKPGLPLTVGQRPLRNPNLERFKENYLYKNIDDEKAYNILYTAYKNGEIFDPVLADKAYMFFEFGKGSIQELKEEWLRTFNEVIDTVIDSLYDSRFVFEEWSVEAKAAHLIFLFNFTRLHVTLRKGMFHLEKIKSRDIGKLPPALAPDIFVKAVDRSMKTKEDPISAYFKILEELIPPVDKFPTQSLTTLKDPNLVWIGVKQISSDDLTHPLFVCNISPSIWCTISLGHAQNYLNQVDVLWYLYNKETGKAVIGLGIKDGTVIELGGDLPRQKVAPIYREEVEGFLKTIGDPELNTSSFERLYGQISVTRLDSEKVINELLSEKSLEEKIEYINSLNSPYEIIYQAILLIPYLNNSKKLTEVADTVYLRGGMRLSTTPLNIIALAKKLNLEPYIKQLLPEGVIPRGEISIKLIGESDGELYAESYISLLKATALLLAKAGITNLKIKYAGMNAAHEVVYALDGTTDVITAEVTSDYSGGEDEAINVPSGSKVTVLDSKAVLRKRGNIIYKVSTKDKEANVVVTNAVRFVTVRSEKPITISVNKAGKLETLAVVSNEIKLKDTKGQRLQHVAGIPYKDGEIVVDTSNLNHPVEVLEVHPTSIVTIKGDKVENLYIEASNTVYIRGPKVKECTIRVSSTKPTVAILLEAEVETLNIVRTYGTNTGIIVFTKDKPLKVEKGEDIKSNELLVTSLEDVEKYINRVLYKIDSKKELKDKLVEIKYTIDLIKKDINRKYAGRIYGGFDITTLIDALRLGYHLFRKGVVSYLLWKEEMKTKFESLTDKQLGKVFEEIIKIDKMEKKKLGRVKDVTSISDEERLKKFETIAERLHNMLTKTAEAIKDEPAKEPPTQSRLEKLGVKDHPILSWVVKHLDTSKIFPTNKIQDYDSLIAFIEGATNYILNMYSPDFVRLFFERELTLSEIKKRLEEALQEGGFPNPVDTYRAYRFLKYGEGNVSFFVSQLTRAYYEYITNNFWNANEHLDQYDLETKAMVLLYISEILNTYYYLDENKKLVKEKIRKSDITKFPLPYDEPLIKKALKKAKDEKVDPMEAYAELFYETKVTLESFEHIEPMTEELKDKYFWIQVKKGNNETNRQLASFVSNISASTPWCLVTVVRAKEYITKNDSNWFLINKETQQAEVVVTVSQNEVVEVGGIKENQFVSPDKIREVEAHVKNRLNKSLSPLAEHKLYGSIKERTKASSVKEQVVIDTVISTLTNKDITLLDKIERILNLHLDYAEEKALVMITLASASSLGEVLFVIERLPKKLRNYASLGVLSGAKFRDLLQYLKIDFTPIFDQFVSPKLYKQHFENFVINSQDHATIMYTAYLFHTLDITFDNLHITKMPLNYSVDLQTTIELLNSRVKRLTIDSSYEAFESPRDFRTLFVTGGGTNTINLKKVQPTTKINIVTPRGEKVKVDIYPEREVEQLQLYSASPVEIRWHGKVKNIILEGKVTVVDPEFTEGVKVTIDKPGEVVSVESIIAHSDPSKLPDSIEELTLETEYEKGSVVEIRHPVKVLKVASANIFLKVNKIDTLMFPARMDDDMFISLPRTSILYINGKVNNIILFPGNTKRVISSDHKLFLFISDPETNVVIPEELKGTVVVLHTNSLKSYVETNVIPKVSTEHNVALFDLVQKINEIKKRLKKFKGRLYSNGLDPEMIYYYIKLGYYLTKYGFKKFEAWAKVMLEKVGKEIEPHLKDIWKEVNKQVKVEEKKLPRVYKTKVFGQITKDTEMRRNMLQISEELRRIAANFKESRPDEAAVLERLADAFTNLAKEKSYSKKELREELKFYKKNVNELPVRYRRELKQILEVFKLKEGKELVGEQKKSLERLREFLEEEGVPLTVKLKDVKLLDVLDTVPWNALSDKEKEKILGLIEQLWNAAVEEAEKQKSKEIEELNKKLEKLLSTTVNGDAYEESDIPTVEDKIKNALTNLSSENVEALYRYLDTIADEFKVELSDTQKPLILRELARELGLSAQAEEFQKFIEYERELNLDEQNIVNILKQRWSRKPATKIQKLKHKIRLFNLSTLHTMRAADMIDGYRNYKGENVKYIKELSRLEAEIKNTVNDITLKFLEELKKLGYTTITEEDKIRISYFLALEQGAETQAQELLWTYEKILKNAKPTEREKKVIDYMRKEFAKLLPQVKEIYETRTNKEFGEVENYFPLVYVDEELKLSPELYLSKRVRLTKNVKDKFTIKRKKRVRKIINTNFLEVFQQGLFNQYWYVKMQPLLDELHALVSTPQYKEAAGETFTQWWKTQIHIIANKGISNFYQLSPFGTMLRRARINVTTAILSLKASTILVQPLQVLVNMAYTVTHFGPIAALRIFTEFTKAWLNPVQALKYVKDSIALTIRKAGEVVVSEDIKSSVIANIKDKIKELGFKAITIADVITAAGVQRALEKILIDEGLSPEEARKEAEFLTATTSGSSEITLRPQMFAHGEILRTLFMLQNFALNTWGVIYHDIIRTGLMMGGWKKKMYALVGLALMFLGSELEDKLREWLDYIIRGKKMKEESEDDLLRKILLFIPRQIPLFGNAIPPYGTIDTPTSRMLEKVGSGAYSIFNKPLKGSLSIAEGVMALKGVPGTIQVMDILEGMLEEELKKEEKKYRKKKMKKKVKIHLGEGGYK